MTDCPTDHDLRRLLAETDHDNQARVMNEHVEDCARCIERLGRLADGEEIGGWSEIREFTNSVPCAGVSVRVPGYEILGEVGRGGMGVIYKARQISLNRLVALKMILAGGHAGPAERSRFRREAEAVARLQHPNIVQIHEIGEYDGLPYLSLEWVEGVSLAQKLVTGTFSLRETAKLVATLARAMHAAHDRGIVHRDLKLANILLAVNPPRDAMPKITDFGLAKRLDDAATRTQSGAVVGTPSYMAPEQAAGDTGAIGPATDVYALGVILYEMLTGLKPFRADSTLEVIKQVLSAEPVPPRRVRPSLPRDLETICLKCLQKERHKRYGSARALAEDLERFLAGEAIRARPAGWWERGVKWARRKPTAAALVATAVLALVGLAGLGIWHTAQLERQARDLRAEAREQSERVRQLLYDADVRVAYSYWKLGEVQPALDLLAHHEPKAGETDHRAFEWHYLWGRCQAERASLTLPAGAAACVHFSPDGKVLACAGSGGPPTFWDTSSWKPREEPVAAASTWVTFSPDGTSRASAHVDGSIRIRNGNTGAERVLEGGHKRPVHFLRFSPDGKLLVSGEECGRLAVWDAVAGSLLATRDGEAPNAATAAFSPDGRTLAFRRDDGRQIRVCALPDLRQQGLLDPTKACLAVAFSHDGRHIATANDHDQITLWEATRFRPIRQARVATVMYLAFSPDDRILAAGGRDGSVRLLDGESLGVRKILRGHNSPVTCLDFSPDGQTLASRGEEGVVKIWDMGAVRDAERLGSADRLSGALALSPDGRILAVADRDGSVRLLDPATWEAKAVLRGHVGEVHTLAFTPAGDTLASGADDGLIRLWDPVTGRPGAVLSGHESSVLCLAFNANGKQLVSGGREGVVKLWDIPSGKEQLLGRSDQAVLCLDVSRDGKLLAFGAGKEVRVAELPAGKRRATLVHETVVTAVAFAHHGRTLAAASREHSLRLWNLATQKARLPSYQPPLKYIHSLCFSPDDKQLAAAGTGTIQIWDGVSLHIRRLLGGVQSSARAVWSPDGKKLAVASIDHDVALWDTASWKFSRQPRPSLPEVYALAFSPDGSRLAVLCNDPITDVEDFVSLLPWLRPGNTIRIALGAGSQPGLIWDVENGKQLAGLPRPQPVIARKMAISPDGRTVVAGNIAGTVWQWDTKTAQPKPTLFPAEESKTYWKGFDLLRKIGKSLDVIPNPDFMRRINGLAYSPDGKLLAVLDEDALRLLDAQTGLLKATLAEKQIGLSALAFSPDSGLLATNHEGKIKLWNIPVAADFQAAVFQPRQTLPGHHTTVRCLAFAADGKTLASGAEEGEIKLWNFATGKARILIGHTEKLTSLAFSPDGQTLASAGFDAAVRLWNPHTGKELGMLEAHAGSGSRAGLFARWGNSRQRRGGAEYGWRSLSLAAVSVASALQDLFQRPTAARSAATHAPGDRAWPWLDRAFAMRPHHRVNGPSEHVGKRRI